MFYKINPKKPVGSEKPLFVWLDEEPTDFIKGMIELNANFYFGVESVELASKEDPDFVKYVKADLVKVQEEIDKLTTLKNRLSGSLK